MEAVLEFQGFKDDYNDFVVKELALVSKYFRCQVVFDSPYKKSFLSEKMQRTAHWLSKHHHNIEWGEPGLPYDEDFIRVLCQPFDVVHTKGSEKVKYLSRFHHDVRDIDTYEEPPHCLLPQHRCEGAKCALRNAQTYFDTFINSDANYC